MIKLIEPTKHGLHVAIIILLLTISCTQKSTVVSLDELDIALFDEGIRVPQKNTNYRGGPLSIAGQQYERGIGAHATSIIFIQLNGKATKFSALIGVDDSGSENSSVEFHVFADKKILYESGLIHVGDSARKVEVGLQDVKRLGLLITDGGDGIHHDYSNWVNAQITMQGGYRPERVMNSSEKYILTPPTSDFSKINGPKVFGARPGNPFLYKIPATGKRPLTYSVENLPPGLVVDSQTGMITGKVNNPGKYKVTLKAKNELGETSREFRLTIGNNICLTPPLGWNGFNSVTLISSGYPDGYWDTDLDQEKVRLAADAMVETGLINHGWTYINIDETWQGQRGGRFNAIQPGEKFSDMQGLVDHIHELGLKAGIYSSPWVTSYFGFIGGSSDFEDGHHPEEFSQNRRKGRYIGKYTFEENDVAQWVDWGIDYLKYDWNMKDVESAERMSDVLKESGRDIVYSLSNSAKFEYAEDWARVANCWRTGGDIIDTWSSLYQAAFTIDKWGPFSGPGHWNDPDMLIIGNVTHGSELHPTRLTADEQYTHISLWSLLSAPMLIGSPVEQLDAFTLSLLSNDEVLEINQDPLGKQARQLGNKNDGQVWVKNLEDGSIAVGLFNTGDFGNSVLAYFNWGDEPEQDVSFDWGQLGITGKYKIRDVWRQKDLGEFKDRFTASVPFRGVVLIRMYPDK